MAWWSQFYTWVFVASVSNFEKSPICESKILFEHLLQKHILCTSLVRKIMLHLWIKTPSQTIGPRPLSKNLLFQMNNCVKDNKNRYLLTFLSSMTTREVFEEVKLGYLVVDHTHEDIDKCFGYLSKILRKQNNYILVDFMKTFMVSHEWPFISQLDSKDSIF